MGNDHSSSVSSRTLISSDESSCWTLYNGVNDRSEPISIFNGKQTFSVECRRSIQFLKTIRHPNIVKFFSTFKTFVDQDSFISECVHPLSHRINSEDIFTNANISLGLYQITQALQFLHEKAKISHNNVCLVSIYLSLNGLWKLGNFECASRYENFNKTFLSSLKLIRSDECFTPEENDKEKIDFEEKEICSIDRFGLGVLIGNLLQNLEQTDQSMKSLLIDLQNSLTNEDPQCRPNWSQILQTDLFQMNFIKVTELLDRLPTVDQSDLDDIVDSLSNFLDDLQSEHFNEVLIRRLLVPFMFLCSTTRTKILPRILIPKNDENRSWISMENFRQYAVPNIVDLFSYHVTSIRLTLLEYFHTYFHLIDQPTLINVVLPQLVYGLKDPNNEICQSTLIALGTMVPLLGADVVVGGQRKQIFTDKIKKETVVFPKNIKKIPKSDSPVEKSVRAEPIKLTKTSSPPLMINKSTPEKEIVTKPMEISPVYTNGHSSPQDEIDDDDGQWSDWDQPIDRVDSPKETTLPRKSVETKSKWNPDAPLGSEYEIPPVVLTKKTTNIVQDEIDDFFKDMAPKVQTVELMKQLETMFSSENATSTEFSNKFGVIQQDQIDNQENEGANGWDD